MRGALIIAAVRTMAHLPDRVKIWLSGMPPVIVDGQQLDPQLQLLRSVRRRGRERGLVEPTVEAGRARYRREILASRGPATRVASARDIEIAGAAGPLRARHYAPKQTAPAPLTVYFHGGGFVIGDLDTHDEPCRILCRTAGIHVLSVEYRLAPEHPFPAAVDDAVAALAWAQSNASALGADPRHVSIGGDSAGANLSAVVCLASRDRPPVAQLLIYPPTDAATPRPSHDLFGEGFFLSRTDRRDFGRHYTPAMRRGERNERVSPLQASDLSNLPPALVITAGFDLLRDEGEAYAEALAAAGTPVRHRRYAGLGHGFIHLTGVCPAARRAMIETATEWRALVSS